MPTRNVNLTEHLDSFVEAGIASGPFSNASEVIREGLRLLKRREQEDQAKLEWLRAAAKDGFDTIDRGDDTTLTSDHQDQRSRLERPRRHNEMDSTGVRRRSISVLRSTNSASHCSYKR